MTTSTDRLSALYAYERKGVVQDVAVVTDKERGRFFQFAVVADGAVHRLRSGELDSFLKGVEAGYATREESADGELPTPKRAK